jgi:hypothetical protein
MTILLALLVLALGVSLLAAGYRIARFAIPLWGFLAGLAVGGDVISSMSGTPFLGTIVGVFVGLTVGLLFGVLAYLYYNIAIVVLLGSVGYWLGSSLIMLFGLDTGILSVTVGLAAGILFGILALLFNAPKYVLIVGTALAGSMTTVGALLLLFNQVSIDNFNYAAVGNEIGNSFFWTLTTVALLLISMAFQTATTLRYSFETWALSDNLGEHNGLTPHHR